MPTRPQTRHPGWTVAATVSGMLRAEILKSKLEQAGIPVVLDYESAGLLFGITANGLPLGQRFFDGIGFHSACLSYV